MVRITALGAFRPAPQASQERHYGAGPFPRMRPMTWRILGGVLTFVFISSYYYLPRYITYKSRESPHLTALRAAAPGAGPLTKYTLRIEDR